MSSGSSNSLRAAAVGLACVLAASAAHAVGVFAQPASVYLHADAASAVESEISLSPTDGSVTVSISVSPFTIDEHGKPRSCECAEARSIRSWGDVSEHRLALESGQRDRVVLRLSVPADASGSYWGAVLIDIDETPRQSGARIRSRIAIPVFVTVRGTESRRIELGTLTAFKSGDGIVVEGSVTNRGNVVLHAPLALAVESGSQSDPVELASIDDAILVVLPEGRRIFRLTIRGDFPDVSQLHVSAFLHDESAVAENSCAVAAAPPCETAGCRGT